MSSPTTPTSELRRRVSIGGSVVTEQDALSKMSEKADQEDDKHREKMELARKIRQQKIDEEQSYSDEERESGGSNSGSRTNTPKLTGPTTRQHYAADPLPDSSSKASFAPVVVGGGGEVPLVNGGERESFSAVHERLVETRTKFEDAMVSISQLCNEKDKLTFTVEMLKDRIEEMHMDHDECQAESRQQLLSGHKLQHRVDSLEQESGSLKAMLKLRDDFLESRGVRLPAPGQEGEQGEVFSLLDSSERDDLQQQIKDLKTEISSLKSNNGQGSEALAGQDQKDIVRESTRLVVEYKSKLQVAEAERQRQEGTIQRLELQSKRLKSQVENLEKREDELIEEKRKQSREIRKLQQEIDELKTDNELLQKRIEGLRKRQQT